jgi:E3 ubiquitin-protein ligase RNF139
MWERLDDYVYYVKATGNTIEFIFGIFLFFNGAWILLFESGGTIRALMMCIHAYFNIWLQARTGWKTFMKRRLAVHKINSLPEATSEQLANFDDVCAICYQELSAARITRCNHYFHGGCLRKWLFVQDICPLCHETLYVMTDEPQPQADAGNDNVNNQFGDEQNFEELPAQFNNGHEHDD